MEFIANIIQEWQWINFISMNINKIHVINVCMYSLCLGCPYMWILLYVGVSFIGHSHSMGMVEFVGRYEISMEEMSSRCLDIHVVSFMQGALVCGHLLQRALALDRWKTMHDIEMTVQSWSQQRRFQWRVDDKGSFDMIIALLEEATKIEVMPQAVGEVDNCKESQRKKEKSPP